VCAAETDEEALYLKSSGLQALINLRTGKPGPLPPPIRDFEKNLCGPEKQVVSQSRSASSTGSLDKITEDVSEFLKLTDADELIITSQIFDHAARVESYAITQQACSGL
jgi:alkanesulfonate monooxygenase SsuD/methylene tetrahydromethanopterin reductase-like flavin-dependent oxidoreductase (luciferase family)